MKCQEIQFVPTSSYIVLRTKCDIPESSEYEAQSFQNENEKQKKITCFPSKQIRKTCKHYIHYLIEKDLNTSEEFSERKLKKIVNYIVELYSYVENKSRYDVTIIRETFDRKSSEFIKLFPNDSTEELDREENSELGINNSLQKLYRFYEHNIVEIPFSVKKLNYKDLFVVYDGTNLIVVFNERNVDQFIYKFICIMARHMGVEHENVNCAKNFYNNKKNKLFFMRLFNTTDEDEFMNSVTENKRKKPEEHYRLYEFLDTDEREMFDTSETGPLSSDLIKAGNWYVLKNLVTRDIFLYITPNLKMDTMKFILILGQEYANKSYKVSIVQPHKLHLSFIIAFKDFLIYMVLYEGSEAELENEIKNKLCKY